MTGRATAISTDPGDHICVFHKGRQERDEIIIPFLRAGLAAGNRCVCVLSGSDHDNLRRAVAGEPAGGDLRHLELVDSNEFYLAAGSFAPQQALDYWDKCCSGPPGEKRDVVPVQAVSDMSWYEHKLVKTIDELVTYEASANIFVTRYPVVALCLYDLDRFEGNVLIPVLRAHHKAFFNGMLFENPYLIDSPRAGPGAAS